MMANKKDDGNEKISSWKAPLSFQFSRPANDNKSPLKQRVITWLAVGIGLGSIIALLVM